WIDVEARAIGVLRHTRGRDRKPDGLVSAEGRRQAVKSPGQQRISGAVAVEVAQLAGVLEEGHRASQHLVAHHADAANRGVLLTEEAVLPGEQAAVLYARDRRRDQPRSRSDPRIDLAPLRAKRPVATDTAHVDPARVLVELVPQHQVAGPVGGDVRTA